MSTDLSKIEHSPYSRDVTRNGITVHVDIFRLPALGKYWTMRVTGSMGYATIWDGQFHNDSDAFRDFEDALETEGIEIFQVEETTQRCCGDTLH